MARAALPASAPAGTGARSPRRLCGRPAAGAPASRASAHLHGGGPSCGRCPRPRRAPRPRRPAAGGAGRPGRHVVVRAGERAHGALVRFRAAQAGQHRRNGPRWRGSALAAGQHLARQRRFALLVRRADEVDLVPAQRVAGHAPRHHVQELGLLLGRRQPAQRARQRHARADRGLVGVAREGEEACRRAGWSLAISRSAIAVSARARYARGPAWPRSVPGAAGTCAPRPCRGPASCRNATFCASVGASPARLHMSRREGLVGVAFMPATAIIEVGPNRLSSVALGRPPVAHPPALRK